ncbi:MAG: endonuclease/exonuclease/phosphatase family protein [Deltaproteobacteria bacterium]|nr:endonuclease/exonuclease/phosphatase family protein [Deltaproteobacteria bacterium]
MRPDRRPLRRAVGLLALGGSIAAVAVGLSRPGPDPKGSTPVPVEEVAPSRLLLAGERIRILSWNVQYAAGRRLHFFYDGGTAVHVPEGDVRATLEGLEAVIAAEAPDLVLLQEVDRDSRRTGRIDQVPPLATAARAACLATASYHRARFVPIPVRHPLGRVDMHLALLSRFPMTGAERVALPLLRESRLRRAFNLKRALLWATLPVEGGPDLDVAVTHLSAFSLGDGTLARQVVVLDAWMREREAARRPFVLAGDLNLLPPGDDPGRLGADAVEYADDPNPVEALLAAHRCVLPDPAEPLRPDQRTYLPFGATLPDRVLDYVFVGPGIEVEDARVLQEHRDLSDHVPLCVDLELPRS